jgi:hypothetical protein
MLILQNEIDWYRSKVFSLSDLTSADISPGDPLLEAKRFRNIEYRFQNPEYRNSQDFIVRNLSWSMIQDSVFDLPARAAFTLYLPPLLGED